MMLVNGKVATYLMTDDIRESKGDDMFVEKEIRAQTVRDLLEKHGEQAEFRIKRGVDQAAELWTKKDGAGNEFTSFCMKYFVADDREYEALFDKLDGIFESLDGHFDAMEITLKEPMDLDIGPMTPIDKLLGGYAPWSHLTDDLFENKIAFVVLVNFPRYLLDEKKVMGETWGPREWAMARLGERFQSRVPAAVQQKLAGAWTAGEAYISEYNIYMDTIRDMKNERLFPDGPKLISHWGLRDELKSWYGQPGGLYRQKAIYYIMRNIITQEIPIEAINNPDVKWNPFENHVLHGSKAEISVAEPDRRYRHMLDLFFAARDVDDFWPSYPTYIKRKFELDREMTEEEIEDLFVGVLTSPQLAQTAELIRKRLSRDLEPFDIWYAGFRTKSARPEAELDKIVKEKYPTADAFETDIGSILSKLGFSKSAAEFLASRIIVEAARGSGHAAGVEMRTENVRLRTRVSELGMTFKNYNIAVHELGHNVEQTLSLHRTGYHMNHGVPFSGFSEAFAFVFQDRDLELLGIDVSDPDAEYAKTVNRFWNTCEIMAVALLELNIWRWLYEYPAATAADLKKATIEISKDIWNRFFAEIFGCKDEIILAIYSHMIDHPLYLAEYPLGHLIHFQIEEHMKGKKIGEEMERMCSAGNMLPQMWMKNAVDAEISAEPFLEATAEALKKMSS
jgi:hypothetical protein